MPEKQVNTPVLSLCKVYHGAGQILCLAEQAYKRIWTALNKSPDSVRNYYIGLSSVYVKQNKFYEAATLLNNVKSDYARVKIGSLRPKPPELSPAPGAYHDRIQIVVKGAEDSICYYMMGDSKEAKQYTEELSPDEGSTTISAVSVSKEGLVSDITKGEYTLDKIIERVYFSDPAIETMVRESLDKPAGTFMTDELWNVKSLTNRAKDGKVLPNTISSFQDLKYFTGLGELKLYSLTKEIPFETIPELPALNSLTLSGCSLTGGIFPKISSFSLMRELDLSNNKIEKLEGISSLKNLEKLNVSGNNISDLRELEALPNLYFLNADENSIKDLSTISGLKKLTWLSIADNRVSDLSPILGFQNLMYLDISKNNFTNLKQLSGLQSLKGLSCKENRMEDLLPLAQLQNLEAIDFQNNRISDITALKALKNLKSVNLSGNDIADLSPISENVQITQLMVSRNKIKDISAIKKLSKLVIIDLKGNPVKDYAPLTECKQLQTVFSDQSGKSGADGALVSGAVEGLPKDKSR